MAWTTVDTIKLTTDWQYTEPINSGVFFRVNHTKAPLGSYYAVAQCELQSNQFLLLDEPKYFVIDKGCTDLIKFSKPAAFGNRRIAIKRLAAQPSIKQQIRDLLLPGFLQPQEEEVIFHPRSEWEVVIEVSDVNEASTVVDLSPIQTKLDEISNKIDNLQTSGGSTGGNTTPSKVLTYQSDGDANGVCYWIGTNYGAEAWTNPHTAGRVTCSLITPFDSNRPPHLLVDRQPNSEPATSDAPNSRIRIDLGAGNKLRPNYYSLRGADRENLHLRSWKFKGSNDDTFANWITLNSQTNNTTISRNAWFSGNASATEGYRYLEIEQIGVSSQDNNNIMTLGEFEFYGDFYKQ